MKKSDMLFSLFLVLVGVLNVLIAVFSDAVLWKRGGLLLIGLFCAILGIYDCLQIRKIVKLISQIKRLERDAQQTTANVERGAQEAGANQTTFNS